MRLNSVEVKNFKNRGFHFVPEKLNVFLGENGAGKTSLCDAVRFGLTGNFQGEKIPGTDVVLTLENSGNPFSIERSWTGDKMKCKINGAATTVTATNDTLVDSIHIPLDRLKITSSAEMLSSLTPGEMSDLFLSYVPSDLNESMLESYLSDANDEMVDEIAFFFLENGITEEFGVEMLNRLYQHFYEKRAELNGAIKNKNAELVRYESITEPTRSIEEIEEDMRSIALQEKGRTELVKRMREYLAAAKKKEQQEATIKSLKARQAAIPLPKAGSWTAYKFDEKAAQEAEGKRTAAEAEIREKKVEIGTINQNIALFTRTLENLEKPVCPISEKLICTTDKTAVKRELKDALIANNRLLEAANRAVTRGNETIERAKAQLLALRTEKSNLDQYTKLSAEIAAFEKNLVVVPEKPQEVTESNFAELKNKLTMERRNLEAFAAKKKVVAELATLSKKQEVYQNLVSQFSGKGSVKANVLKHFANVFERMLEARTKAFAPGYQMQFDFDGGLCVRMKTPKNKEFYPIGTLSAGEGFLAKFLLLDTLSQLTGTGILFLDNLETLDKEVLCHLKELITKPEFLNAYDHIFLCGVNHKEVTETFEDLDAVKIAVVPAK